MSGVEKESDSATTQPRSKTADGALHGAQVCIAEGRHLKAETIEHAGHDIGIIDRIPEPSHLLVL